jgi:hypothetical protein
MLFQTQVVADSTDTLSMKLLPLFATLIAAPLFAQSTETFPLKLNIITPAAPAVEVCEEPPKQTMLCQDLYRLSCAAGEYDDGTGISQGGSSLEDKVASFKTQASTLLKAKYENLLSEGDSAYVRELALAAYGLKDTSFCEAATSKTCISLLAKNMADLSLKRMFAQNTYAYGKAVQAPGVQDLDLLVSNSRFKEAEKAVSQDMQKKIKSLTIDEKKISDEIFPKVKSLIIDLIEKRVADPATKDLLRKKISSITYNGSSCGVTGAFDSGPSLTALLVPNAFYDPNANSFQFCNGFLLMSNSEFMLAHVIAHELSHSFDPCWITKGPSTTAFTYPSLDLKTSEETYPFKDVISCLRTPESVEAKSAEDLMKSMQSSYGGGMGGSVPMGYGIGSAPQVVHPLCAGDQLGEALPDWIATEILPTYIADRFPNLTPSQRQIGYSNVWRSSCVPAGTPLNPMDPHIETQHRVNRLLILNPLVRKQMGCPDVLPAGTRYCGETK